MVDSGRTPWRGPEVEEDRADRVDDRHTGGALAEVREYWDSHLNLTQFLNALRHALISGRAISRASSRHMNATTCA